MHITRVTCSDGQGANMVLPFIFQPLYIHCPCLPKSLEGGKTTTSSLRLPGAYRQKREKGQSSFHTQAGKDWDLPRACYHSFLLPHGVAVEDEARVLNCAVPQTPALAALDLEGKLPCTYKVLWGMGRLTPWGMVINKYAVN